MSNYSPPDRPAAEIINVLSKTGIAALRPEDLANPNPDLVFAIYTNFISYVDPLSDDSDGQIGFDALTIIDNPEYHAHSIRTSDLYHRVKVVLSSIHVTTFSLRDLLAPDHRRTLQILSSIVNFLYHRDDKMNMLQPIADQLSAFDERRMELEERIEELNKEILAHEVARQMEEPMVQEVDAEIKELKQTIQSYSKQQASLKNRSMALKEKIDAIEEKGLVIVGPLYENFIVEISGVMLKQDDFKDVSYYEVRSALLKYIGQISRVDFKFVQCAQETSDLSSKIVQSPEKLQRALELKKSNRAEIKNFERLAEQSVQEKSAKLEVYSKREKKLWRRIYCGASFLHAEAFEKISKHLAHVQALQEHENSAKTVDKDLKAIKDKLNDEGVLNMTLEAKIAEWQRKAKQAEELIQVKEKERDRRHTEDSQILQAVRTEMEQNVKFLEPRERNLEAVVAKSESLCTEADLVREAGKVKQHKLQAKLEEVIHMLLGHGQSLAAVRVKETLLTGDTDGVNNST